MLKEAIDRIAQLVEDSTRVHTFHPDAEPGHVYYLVTKDGECERRNASPYPRAHTAYDLDSLAAYAVGAESSVWYSRAGVTLLIEDEIRRNRVSLGLTLSKQLRTLMGLEESQRPLTQKDFVKLLRVTLYGTLGSAGNLLANVGTLKFRKASESAAVVQRGKESLGKSIEQQLTNSDTIPESVVLEVPVFENLLLTSKQIKCAIEIDLASETFQLIPFPGEIEWALQQAERQVGERLKELLPESLVCFGKP